MTRIASTPFYPNGTVVAQWGGWGVLASHVPASGTNGPALAYPSLTLPAQAGEEVRIELLTTPAAGSFAYFDDTAATLTGAPDGAWTSMFRVYIGEVDQGTATATFIIGNPFATLAGSLDSITGNLAAGLPITATLAGALDSITGNLTTGQPTVATLSGALDSMSGNLMAGVFSFSRPRQQLSLVPTQVRTIGGQTLG